MQPEQPAVDVRGLVFTIGKQTVLKEISFCVRRGECFGIFGTRGTGKTSLLHILAGVLRFNAGRVEILGYDAADTDRYKHGIGLVTQERSLFQDLNTSENLDYVGVLKGSPRKQLAQLVDRLELGEYLDRPVKLLEAGAYQRLSLACALLNSPKVLLVDELINDVDIHSRRIIIRELKAFLAEGGSCLWGFSNSEYFAQMDRVGWLEDSKMLIYTAQQAAERWQTRIQALYLPHGETNA